MFETITRDRRETPRHGTVPVMISIVLHALATAAVVALPVLYVTAETPVVPDMMAFVPRTAPALPPPPPPPPPPPAAAEQPKPTPRPVTRPAAPARPPAPVEAPAEIAPEPAEPTYAASFDDEGWEAGVMGGVPGGVPGGVLGGVPGGVLFSDVVPPPPPAEPEPIRVGGAIKAPALIERVNPVYPALAQRAQVQGTVILEAIVGRDGRVEQVEVLRSIPLLDQAAIQAVKQWRYSPLLLNGRPERFVLTVTVSFHLTT